MDRVYRGMETGLLGLTLGLVLAAFTALAVPRETAAHLAVTLPMLTVTAR